jgi:hypothetical protein
VTTDEVPVPGELRDADKLQKDTGAAWEGWAIVGLEVHVELTTRPPRCGAAARPTSAADPNTNVCPVCTGQPGALPVVNAQAVEDAALLGLALNWVDRRGVPVPPQELLLPRPGQELPDQPVRRPAVPRRLARRAEVPRGCRAPRRHRTPPHGGGHRQVHPRRRHRPPARRRPVPDRLQPLRHPAARDRLPPRHPRPRDRAGLPARAAGHRAALGVSDARMEEGSIRCDANVSVAASASRSAPAARSRTSTRSARSVAPSPTRRSARSPCSRTAAPSSWRPGTGTRARRHRDAPPQGVGDRLPLLPGPGPRRGRLARRVGRRGLRACPSCRRRRGPSGRGRRPADAAATLVGSDMLAGSTTRSPPAPRRRRRPTGSPATSPASSPRG